MLTERAPQPLGTTGLVLPGLGLGTATFGYLYRAVSPADASAIVSRAVELGVTYLDTAPSYGLGQSEAVVGSALRAHHIDPDSLVLSSKCGWLMRPWQRGCGRRPAFPGAPRMVAVPAWDEVGIRRSIEDSLTRLGLDHLDIVYLHDPPAESEPAVVGEAFPALEAMRAQGLIAAIGAGMNDSAALTRFVNSADLDVVMLAGRYTLLEQAALGDLLPACQDRQTRVVIGGAFNSGLLADPSASQTYDHAPAPANLVQRAQAIQAVCRDNNVDIVSAALQFPLGHPSVISVLAGMRSVDEVERNVAAFAEPIPSQLWVDLQSAGLVTAAAPTP